MPHDHTNPTHPSRVVTRARSNDVDAAGRLILQDNERQFSYLPVVVTGELCRSPQLLYSTLTKTLYPLRHLLQVVQCDVSGVLELRPPEAWEKARSLALKPLISNTRRWTTVVIRIAPTLFISEC